MTKKKVVVIGGGNGTAICLEGLKDYIDKFEITAVVATSDSGGSSGRLRREFKTLPPGDIMRAVLSLSKYDYKLLRNIFYKPRFSGVGKLNTHNLGNLFLTLTGNYSKNFLYAVEALSQSVEAQGKVYPVTLENIDLCAKLNNGKIIKTEAFIDTPVYNRGWKIAETWLEPKAQAFPLAMKAIKEANVIILSPGSLYTSLVAALLPTGIKESIEKSKAKIIYASARGYRLEGETGPEKLSGVISRLEQYLPRPIDLIIFNNHKLNKKQVQVYKENKWGLFDLDKENLKNKNIKGFALEAVKGGMDTKKLSKIFLKVI